jgi:hypothetical protein
MQMKYLYAIVIIVSIASCSHPEKDDRSLKIINLKESNDILPISSFADQVDYVELKAKEAGLEIGEIEMVKVIAGDYLVKRRFSGKSSFIRFSRNGDYITEIAGENQSKIQEPIDILMHPKGYAVMAANGIHLVAKDGKYLQPVVRSKISGSAFFSSEEHYYTINETDPEHLLNVYPSNGRNLRPVSVANERLFRMLSSSVSEPAKGKIHIFSSLNDTIFAFQTKNLVPVYRLSGGNLPTLAETWKQVHDMKDNDALRYLHETEHIEVKSILESRNFIYLHYWVGSNATTAILDKNTWQAQYFKRGMNDIDGGLWDEVNCLTENDELIIPISAYKVGGHKISNKKVKGFDELQNRIAKSANPVLMRCKLRR